MPNFNPADYEPVEDRIRRFYADWPNGRIVTSLVWQDENRCIFSAMVFRSEEHREPTATGYAEETRGAGMVNKTNHVENCETSAIGRALANAGYAPKGQRPSREEMAKAVARDQKDNGVSPARNELRSFCAGNGLDLGQVATAYQRIHGHPLVQETNPELVRGFLELLKMDANAVLNSETTT